MNKSRCQNLFLFFWFLLLASIHGCSQEPAGNALAPPPPPPSAEALADLDPKGVALIRQQYDQAVRSPDSWQARFNLAKAYHAHAFWDRALEAHQQALQMAPQEAVISHLISLVKLSKGDTAGAIESMRRTVALEPWYVPAQYLLALELRDQGRLDQAAAVAQQAVQRAESQFQRNPNDQSVFSVLQTARLASALILLDLNQPRIAALQSKAAFEADTRNRYAVFIYGTALRQLGQEEASARYVQLGQGAKPDWIDPWSHELGDFQVGYQADLVRSNHYLTTGDPGKTIEILMPYHEEDPDDVVILTTLAAAYRINGNAEIAGRLLRKAIQLDPDYFEARVMMVGLYRELLPSLDETVRSQQLGEALAHADKAIEMRPTSSNAYAVKADLLYSTGFFSQAADLYLEAARLDEQRRGLDRQAATVLCKAERWEEAIVILQRLVNLYHQDVQLLNELAEAQLEAGQIEQAQQTIAQIEAVEPNSPVIAPLRAAINRARP